MVGQSSGGSEPTAPLLEFAIPATPQAMIERARTLGRWNPPDIPIATLVNLAIAIVLVFFEQLLASAIVFAASLLIFMDSRLLLYEAWAFKRRFPSGFGPMWTFQIGPHGVSSASESCRSFTPWQAIATIVASKTTMLFFDADKNNCQTIALSLIDPTTAGRLRQIVAERAPHAQQILLS